MSDDVVINSSDAIESESSQDVDLGPSEISSEVPRDLPFGAVVRYFRRQKGLTQIQLAEALNHHVPEFIGMIECGQRQINLEEVVQLGAVLRIDARDLGIRALREYFPRLAAALFGDRSSDGELPGSAVAPAGDLLPASAALARRWQELTPKHRGVIAELVEALLKSSGRKRCSRGKKKQGYGRRLAMIKTVSKTISGWQDQTSRGAD